MADEKVKRVPVDFDYSALNWDFLKQMAQIPPYATEKYGAWQQYSHARLEGEKSPENHIVEHLRSYMLGEPYDKFDGDVGRHLAAIAYNAMMAWYYLKKFGHVPHPLKLGAQAEMIVRMTIDRPELKDGEGGVLPVNTFVTAPVATAEWAEGLNHYAERWRAGLDGARDPGAIRRWQAMLDVISCFVSVDVLSDAVVFALLDDVMRDAKEAMFAEKSPENIETQKAKIAACETIRGRLPEMFPKKAGG